MKPFTPCSGSTSLKLLLVVLCLFHLAACKDTEQPLPQLTGPAEPAYGDALVSGTIGDASNLIPYLGSDTSSSSEVTDMVYDGLAQGSTRT